MEPFDLRTCYPLREAMSSFSDPCIIDQIAIDSRRISSRNALFIALTGSHFDGHVFVKQAYRAGARTCIIKQGSKIDDLPPQLRCIQVPDPLKALQQIAACYRQSMRAKVIAITGSYGKTMLKDLMEHLLSASYNIYVSPESFNSQLGVALSLLKIRKEHDFAIIEAGISRPDEMAAHVEIIKPDHVIITNIGMAHIASLGSKEKIASEKMKLFSQVPLNNWCMLPSDPLLLAHMPKRAQCYAWDQQHPQLPHVTPLDHSHSASFSYEIRFPNGVCSRGSVADGFSYLLDLLSIAVKGAHLLGIPPHIVSKQLESYLPEPMRIELWKTPSGATVINDTYCADPMSCDLAMRQFDMNNEPAETTPQRKIFLFSGMRKGSQAQEIEMERVAHAIAKHHVDLCILPQQAAVAHLVASINLISPHTEVVVTATDHEALFYAKNHLRAGDVLLIKGAVKQRVNDIMQILEESLPNNQVVINLAAIQSNIELVRAKLPSQRIMVMVKALAYGTDDVRIAKFLQSIGIDILGVSYVDEGVAMRQAGINQAIFVLNAAEYEAQKAVKWGLEIGVSEPQLIHALQRHAKQQGKIIRVHLHVNTGMTRFGCKPDQAAQLATLIASSSHLILEGLMTHFASADNPEQDDFTRAQSHILQSVYEALREQGHQPKWVHACNSSAAIRFGFTQFNMVRIGLAAYGLHASSASKTLMPLQPAISLVSRIVGINECVQGETISYGRTHTVATERARIAVLPIGYFDGLHRNYSGKGQVMIRGKLAPMVGRICMDYMMTDITSNPTASVGDPVLIFGEDETGHYLSPEELAHQGGSIVHELMTCLGPRIRRLFIYDESLRPR